MDKYEIGIIARDFVHDAIEFMKMGDRAEAIKYFAISYELNR